MVFLEEAYHHFMHCYNIASERPQPLIEQIMLL